MKLFLDIHSHSTETSIFTYSPLPNSPDDQATTRRFVTLLDEMSEFFRLDHCRFNNEKYKRNCARLGIFRDYNLANSFTIETSCFGYKVKRQLDQHASPPSEIREDVFGATRSWESTD